MLHERLNVATECGFLFFFQDQKQLPPPIVFDLQEEKIAVPRSLVNTYFILA